jgi:hypothetical protein
MKNILIMLKRLDKHFPKMDLKPENILFIPKRVDKILPNFDKILRNLDKRVRNLYFLSFWHYCELLKYYLKSFLSANYTNLQCGIEKNYRKYCTIKIESVPLPKI